MSLKQIFFTGIIAVLFIQAAYADNLRNMNQFKQQQTQATQQTLQETQNTIQDPFFELTQVTVKSDGEATDGEDEDAGEGFWDWVLDVFNSEDTSSDGESGVLDNILDGELNIFSLVQRSQKTSTANSKVLLQDGEAQQDGESMSESDQETFLDWILDVLPFGGDGESSFIPNPLDGEFSNPLPNPLDGEIFSLLQVRNTVTVTSKSDGESDSDSESSEEGGFFDWIMNIIPFTGDGESSLLPDMPDGEFLDVVPNPLDVVDGEILSLLSSQTTLNSTDGEGSRVHPSQSETEEEGFFDWIMNVIPFVGDGESSLLPDMPDGEFLDVVPNPLDVVDGELISLISLRKTSVDLLQVQQKQSQKCTEPVSKKWGKQVWNDDWSGEWKFNKNGDTFGVEYNSEFLALAQFDTQGNAKLLFKNNNACTSQLSSFLEEQSMTNTRGDVFLSVRQVDGEMITDVIPDVDGEYLEYVPGTDGEWIPNPFDGEFLDFMPNPFDGEFLDFMPNPFDGEMFDFMPNPFDGEMFDFMPNPFDGEFGLGWMPNPFDGEFFDFVPNPMDGEYLPDGEFFDPIDGVVPDVDVFGEEEG